MFLCVCAITALVYPEHYQLNQLPPQSIWYFKYIMTTLILVDKCTRYGSKLYKIVIETWLTKYCSFWKSSEMQKVYTSYVLLIWANFYICVRLCIIFSKMTLFFFFWCLWKLLPHADSVFSTLTYMFRSVQGVEANQLSYRSVFHHKMLVSLFVPIDH